MRGSIALLWPAVTKPHRRFENSAKIYPCWLKPQARTPSPSHHRPTWTSRQQTWPIPPSATRAKNALQHPRSVCSVPWVNRSEEHTSEPQSRGHLVCRLLLEKTNRHTTYVFYLS